jgi:hypothetical protein
LHASAFAQLGSANTFTANQNIQGNVTATGTVTGSNVNTTATTAALGIQALFTNPNGTRNTAAGAVALYCGGSYSGTCTTSGSGSQNTAVGFAALHRGNNLGSNTAVGDSALGNLTSGGSNIALGNGAGLDLTGGNSNIYLSNSGQNAESSTIRIGDVQTQAFVAGISGVAVTNAAQVLIDANGQLGTAPSSRQFKEKIQDMGDASSNVMRLRPVMFRYRPEYVKGPNIPQYGLIAEEVASVYPNLVQYNNDGEPVTVLYHLLTPMLLNEIQRLHRETAVLVEAVKDQQERIQQLKARLDAPEAKGR